MEKMLKSVRFPLALVCVLFLSASCGQSSSSTAPSSAAQPVPAAASPEAASDSASPQTASQPAPASAAVPAPATAPAPSSPAASSSPLAAVPASASAPAAIAELPTAPVSVAALLGAAGKADFAVLSIQAADAERAGLAEALIADLEARAAAPDAPPEVHVALSALYGRKGLKTKEYAALAAAETAAAKPGISFNVALVHGRKSLLAGAPDADSFMVGGLELASDPPGASVWIDGAPAGSCPVRVEKVRAGTRKLRFAMQGYSEAETTAEVGVGSSVAVAAALKPRPALVTISCDEPKAKLSVDGGEPGPAGTPVEVAPGRRSFVLSEVNRKPVSFELDLEPGSEVSKSFKMEIASHKWMIITSPSGVLVSLNGRPIGTTPIGEIELPAGSYDIKYELADHVPISKKEKLMLGEDGFNFPYISERLSFRIPTRTIKIDGKKDDWNGVSALPGGSVATDLAKDAPGTHIKRVLLCQDDKSVYWMMEFHDGKPAKSTGFVYSVEFYTDPKSIRKHIALKLGIWKDASGYKPHLPYGPDGTGRHPDVWGGNGSSANYAVGPDFIEVKFPKSLIATILKPTVPYRVAVCTYIEGAAGSSSLWSGFDNKAVRFE